MADTIKCPHCGERVEVTEALKHQIQEKLLGAEKKKFQQALMNERKKFESNLDDEKKRFRQAFDNKIKEIKEQAQQKTKEDFETKLKSNQEEIEEQKQRNKKLLEELTEMNKQIRQLKEKDEQRQLEMEKKLTEEQDKLKDAVKKQVEEQQRMKILEKDKQLQDAIKANEDLRRKLEQGSQQTQGEVLELELEEMLGQHFPLDDIKEVPKGIRGADVIQIVKDQAGRSAGSIIWESKNTKNWSDGWLNKLKNDQREVKAELAVIVSSVIPDDIKNLGQQQGIWICSRESIIGLATALRLQLIQLFKVRKSAEGKSGKMEILYQYLTGTEFKQRVEAIVEAFTEMQSEMEKEKRWFAKKWASQEKSIRQVIDQTHGMHGDLQSIVGASLPEIKSLELESGENNDESDEDGNNNQTTLL